MRDADDDVDMDAAGAGPMGEDSDASGGAVSGGSGRADSAGSAAESVDELGDAEDGSDSDESVFAQIFGHRLEARGHQQCGKRNDRCEFLTRRHSDNN